MFKLIKLEIKKTKMQGYITGSIIANASLIGILLIIIFGSKSDGELAFESYAMAFQIISSLVKMTFIVFASALLARLVIDEYKNDTISLLFLYPINRKKLLTVKLIIVSVFTFVNIVLSNILLDFTLVLVDYVNPFMPDKLTTTTLNYNLISIVMNAFTSSFMALIPLYFGMKKKSVSATILSSLLIVVMVCSNMNGFSLDFIIAVPIILAIFGALIAYLSIRNIEHVDVMK